MVRHGIVSYPVGVGLALTLLALLLSDMLYSVRAENSKGVQIVALRTASFLRVESVSKVKPSMPPSPSSSSSSSDGGGGENPSEEKETEEYLDSMFVVLGSTTAVLLIAAAFEYGKELLEESAGEELEPVIESLFGELALLGFIGLLMFLITHESTALESLSIRLFGQEEKTAVSELFENVHMVIFLIMIVYFIQVLALMYYAKGQGKRWKSYERMARERELTGDSTLTTALESYHQDHSWLKWWLISREEEANIYFIMRKRFVHNLHLRHQKLTHGITANDFDLSEYLCRRMIHFLAEVVDVPSTMWIFVELVCLIVCGLGYALVKAFSKINISVSGMGIFCLAFAWLLMMTTVILFVKLNSIYDNLMPMCESGGTDNEGHKQNSHKLNSGIENKENDSNTTPLLCDKALGALAPYEHLTLKPRTDFYHWLLGPPPTRHQMLFWMDRLGVHVIMYIIQGILLNTAMFLSVFFAQFLVPAFGSKSPFPSFFLILAVFLALVPIGIAWTMVPGIVTDFVTTTSIEEMVNKNTVSGVVRHVKSKKALRAMILFNMMRDKTQSEMKVKKLMKGNNLLGTTSAAKMKWKNAAKSVVKNEDKALDMFKVTFSAARRFSQGSNTFKFNDAAAAVAKIKADERDEAKALGKVEEMGIELEDVVSLYDDDLALAQKRRDLRDIFDVFDKDGSGEIDREELCELLIATGQASDHDSAAEMVELIDVDQSNRIDFQEFFEFIARKDASPTHRSVEDMVAYTFQSIDKDGSGSISTEEFATALMTFAKSGSLSMDDVRELVNDADKNKDGHVDLKEFTEMIEDLMKH